MADTFLSLGKTKKKAFVPNIPARRIPKTEPCTPNNDLTKKRDSKSGSSSKRGSAQRSSERGRPRGRGRGAANVIQSHSVFEDSPGCTKDFSGLPGAAGYGLSRSSETCDAGTPTSSGVARPKTKNLGFTSGDLYHLLDDVKMEVDFDEDVDADISMTPVTLPFLNNKPQPLSVKTEAPATKDTAGMPENLMHIQRSSPSIDIGCSEFLLSKIDNDDANLILLKFPDVLPGGVTKEVKEQNEKLSQLHTLSHFSDGKIGKLQIFESGRVRLLLNDISLDVSTGAPAGFLQEVVSLKSPQEDVVSSMNAKGRIVSLGKPEYRLVCTPDFEDLVLHSQYSFR